MGLFRKKNGKGKGFLGGLFKKKQGGTKVGNFLRGKFHDLTGGLIGTPDGVPRRDRGVNSSNTRNTGSVAKTGGGMNEGIIGNELEKIADKATDFATGTTLGKRISGIFQRSYIKSWLKNNWGKLVGVGVAIVSVVVGWKLYQRSKSKSSKKRNNGVNR